MPPHETVLTLTLGGLAAITILATAGLIAWSRWIGLQRETLGQRAPSPAEPPPIAGRIELADLRERVRKLEAIAAGVDL